MNALIGDIGNTTTKICLIEIKTFKVKKIIYFNSNNISSKNFLKKNFNKILKKKSVNKVSLFSSVVPKYQSILEKFLKKNYNIQFREIKEKNINKIVKINIKNKNQVGSDRIANAAGVYRNYKTNCIVLDFGTATTFDVVIKGVYKGGIIAPGLKLSLNTLVKKAELIPSISLKKVKKVIGNNTINALRSGFFWGYTGLIYNIVKLIKKESNCKFMIILTGGFSHLFKNSLKPKALIDSDITIKGLIKILKTKII